MNVDMLCICFTLTSSVQANRQPARIEQLARQPAFASYWENKWNLKDNLKSNLKKHSYKN